MSTLDMNSKIRLVWHRKGDLRLHDNELYHLPTNNNNDKQSPTIKTVSLYVINPNDYAPRPVAAMQNRSSSMKTVTEGPHASRALIAALTDLRSNLQALGGTLMIHRGDPLLVVPQLAEQLQADHVVWNDVPGYYERQLSERMKQRLQNQKIRFQTVAGYTLWHPNDLPQDETTWSQLARPKQQQKSSIKKKQRYSCRSLDVNNTKERVFFVSEQHEVDCSPERWKGIPRIMGDFRRAARTAASVRPCIASPSKEAIQSIHDINSANNNDRDNTRTGEEGALPTFEVLTAGYQGLSLFGLPSTVMDSIIQKASSIAKPTCGETSARKEWEHFLQNHAANANRSLADTSNHQSAHISTYLALGVLSPRHIYWSVMDQQQKQQSSDENKDSSCQWLVSHMEMRDYFMMSAMAADQKLYSLQGQQQPVHKRKHLRKDPKGHCMIVWKNPEDYHEDFARWAMGDTSLPLLDAGMKELMTTGYCSNRVRQNMASVLAKDLHLDWRIGAEWFQFCLEDHCVAANWGNWQYFSGVGGDPKNRHFRTVSQAIRYDPHGSYVQTWLPKLRELVMKLNTIESDEECPSEVCFCPWDFCETWPSALVDPSTQYTWQDKERLEATGSVLEKKC